MIEPASGLGAWIGQVLQHNAEPIGAAAQRLVGTFHAGGLVYTAGSGHSLAMVMETFFRAGGLAIVRPLFSPELLPLTGAMDATRAERQAGLGIRLMERADPTPADTVVVFSNSGRNPYPVEVALMARRAGATVVAFTSLAVSSLAAPRGTHRLFEVSDIVVDTRTPLGDVSRPESAPVTSPLSTLACCALWNEILAAAVALEPTIPLWRSANRDGNDVFNASLASQLSGRIPEL